MHYDHNVLNIATGLYRVIVHSSYIRCGHLRYFNRIYLSVLLPRFPHQLHREKVHIQSCIDGFRLRAS